MLVMSKIIDSKHCQRKYNNDTKKTRLLNKYVWTA